MAYIATVGGRSMTSSVTTVDCQKQVRSWRLLRSLMELLIPTCNCTFQEEQNQDANEKRLHKPSTMMVSGDALMTSTTITGTLLGSRKGKVSFCIQANANSTDPILFLELSIPTSVLAKEMRGGTLRIVLESASTTTTSTTTLFSTPLWTMYCNGRRVGYAVNRRPSNADFEALTVMRSVDVGTGVINHGKEFHHEENDQELTYLRANFQRVRGGSSTSSSSSHCESFHLIDPEGCIGQELSIFFFRSTR